MASAAASKTPRKMAASEADLAMLGGAYPMRRARPHCRSRRPARKKRGAPGVSRRPLRVSELRCVERKSRQRPTLPPGYPGSTIGAGGLNGRVRNGNGCDPSAMVTGVNLRCRQPKDPERRGHWLSKARPSGRFEQNKHHGQASRPISTRKLKALLPLHIGPINLVVYEGSLGRLPCGRRHLEAGFTLRCFQRLSQPNLATQLCLWRDNRCTRGSSIQVLSY